MKPVNYCWRTLVLSLASALLLYGTAQAQTPINSAYTQGLTSPVNAAKQNWDAAKFNELIEKARKSGNIKLIIGLRSDSEPLATTAIDKRLSQDAVTARHQAISRLQEKQVRKLHPKKAATLKHFKHIPFLSVELEEAEIELLRDDPDVVSIEEDKLVRPALAQSIPYIGANLVANRGGGYTIAILDSGVDKSHPFLAGAIPPEVEALEACFSTTYTPHQATSLCPNGQLSQTGSGAGAPCDVGSIPGTGCHHGTHVAGIAAGDNGSGLTGVATQAFILPIQIFSRFDNSSFCGGTTPCLLAYSSDYIQALEWVYQHRNDLNFAAVNMSLGGDVYPTAKECDLDNTSTKAAIDNLRSVGIATVIAAGNDGSAIGISTPGCISSAISVGATGDTSDGVASFSNSASWLSLFAPGISITSSVLNGTYGTWNGTSMATPHVAGAIASVKAKAQDEQGIDAGVDQVVNALQSTGVPVTDPDNGMTIPRLQVDDAVNAITLLDQLPGDLILDSSYTNIQSATQSGSFSCNNLTYDCPAGVFSNQAYGGLALKGIATGLNKFRFTPDLQLPGYYQLYAWWPASPANSNAAQFDIFHDTGTSTFAVDQTINGGLWNNLGAYSFSTDGSAYVELSNPNGGSVVADALRFTYRADLTPLFVHTVILPAGATGAFYNAQLTADGGTPPYTWNLSSGNPPSGLDLGSGNGILSGTPTAGGNYDFSVTVTDAIGATATQPLSLSISGFVSIDFGHPYLQSPTADGITLLWWSSDSSTMQLEYGENGYTQNLLSAPVAVTFIRPEYGNQITRYKHEVALNGLVTDSVPSSPICSILSGYSTPATVRRDATMGCC